MSRQETAAPGTGQPWAAKQGGGQPEPDPTRWRQLAVVMAGAFLILLDSTIVNVAIPSIQRDLGAGNAAVEWVITGYALSYGLLLIPGGRLGDRYGYKRLFTIAVTGFTIASLLCGSAQSIGQLIAWQVVLGAMAGLMNPQILAVIQTAFPWQERGKAYGIYGAVSGVATAMAPLLAGLLIQWNVADLDWRPIFLINVPIGLVTVLAAIKIMSPAKGRGGSLDPLGILLVSTTVFLVGFPLIEGQNADWPVWIFGMLAAAVPALVVFVVWQRLRERRGQEPLISMKLFRNRAFSVGVAIGFTYFAGFISLWFIMSIYLQAGLQRSALTAGLILLPFAIGTLIGALYSDKLNDKLGRWVMAIGLGLVIAGLAGLLVTVYLVDPSMSGYETTPSLFLAGLGSGLVIAPNVDAVMSAVGWADAGSAAGVLNVAQRIGSALGIAIVGIAFFGTLQATALDSAQEVAPRLRAELAATGMMGSTANVDAAAQQFVVCYDKRARSDDPSKPAPGCPNGGASDPVGATFDRAAQRTARLNFTEAVRAGAFVSLGLVVAAFLLVFALPGRPADQGDGDWGGSGGEDGDWSGSGDGGDWSGSGDGGDWSGSGEADDSRSQGTWSGADVSTDKESGHTGDAQSGEPSGDDSAT